MEVVKIKIWFDLRPSWQLIITKCSNLTYDRTEDIQFKVLEGLCQLNNVRWRWCWGKEQVTLCDPLQANKNHCCNRMDLIDKIFK